MEFGNPGYRKGRVAILFMAIAFGSARSSAAEEVSQEPSSEPASPPQPSEPEAGNASAEPAAPTAQPSASAAPVLSSEAAEPPPTSTASLPPPDNPDWFNGNLNGVRLYADDVLRPRDPVLYQSVDADLAELESDRRLAWMFLGGGIAAGVATMAYPILTDSGCSSRVPPEDVQDCENQRFSAFAVPAALLAAAGVILYSTTKPSKDDVVEIVKKHGLRARAGLAFSLKPQMGQYAGRLSLQF
jgi:hypothetical protein